MVTRDYKKQPGGRGLGGVAPACWCKYIPLLSQLSGYFSGRTWANFTDWWSRVVTDVVTCSHRSNKVRVPMANPIRKHRAAHSHRSRRGGGGGG